MKSRAEGYKKGAALLNQIIRGGRLTESSFRPLYEGLVSEVWHSGGLHRGKNIIIAQAEAFQAALQSLERVHPKDAAPLFEHLLLKFGKVERVGTNVLTEILHTFDNVKFAVVNRNSVSGMRLAKITGFPDAPNKQNLDGAKYALFCAQAAKVRDALGLKISANSTRSSTTLIGDSGRPVRARLWATRPVSAYKANLAQAESAQGRNRPSDAAIGMESQEDATLTPPAATPAPSAASK